ncbi:MAG TPA: MraY family glycosyltransferase [Pirellulales bacterium]|nr:MraY family glycosyltransferase [Pirellulales bacterium]
MPVPILSHPLSGGQWFIFLAAAVGPSLAISWVAAFWLRRHAPRWGLVDRPGARKVHTSPTPLGGGLAIWLGVLLPFAVGQLLLWIWHIDPDPFENWLASFPALRFIQPFLNGLWLQSADLWLLLGLGTLLLALGLVDDYRGVDWRLRLGAQTLAAIVVVFVRGWKLSLVPHWPWAAGLLSLLWIVGLVNSFNMLDNMDGLSAGVGAIAAAMLAAVMLLVPDPQSRLPHLFVAGFLLVLVGSLLGFLWHNRPPARIFMGDAGSYFLGFSLATIATVATYAGGDLPRHAILAPICVLAVPLYDLATVMAIRLREGRSPFQADKSHFSHRLVELGLSKTQAVLTIYLLTATCGLGALLLHEVDQVGAMMIVLLVGCVLLLIGILETAARRRRTH